MKKKIPDLKQGEKIIEEFLQWLGIEKTQSTQNTPMRIAKMYIDDLFSGLYEDPPKITTFDVEESESSYVCVTDIKFNSMCEHHFLPFMGVCGVVYAVGEENKVIGLSKIPRIVRHWSLRPQLQERLTQNIAEDIMERLKPQGVYVLTSARHTCMEIRGVKSLGSLTNHAYLLGDIDKEEAIKLLNMNNFFNNK